MSATDRALDAMKSVFTYREQIASLRQDLTELGSSMRALANSHAQLRDRVSRIEGYLGRVGDADLRRLP
jgi:hypothetical protein